MNVTNFLPTIAFSFLLLLMLLYWSQAAFFGREKYKTLNDCTFLFSILSLTTLLLVRWIESGHFPLSNLYESLLFLSWSFLTLNALFRIQSKQLFFKNSRFLSFSEKKSTFSLSPASTFFSNKVFEKISVLPSNAFREDKESVPSFSLSLSSSSCLGLGVILSPLSLLTFGFAFLSLPKEMQQATALVPALQSNWLMMHVTVMILSYAALLAGSILSIAFLILTRLESNKSQLGQYNVHSDMLSLPKQEQEKFQSFDKNGFLTQPKAAREQIINMYNNEPSTAFRLTAQLDNWSYRILALGFPLLTIGILSGAVWANEAWGSYWSWDPKETWALITWLVFAIYLHTRITKGWSGEKPAIVASLGFFMVWFCYLGVNLLGTGLHSYGWFSK